MKPEASEWFVMLGSLEFDVVMMDAVQLQTQPIEISGLRLLASDPGITAGTVLSPLDFGPFPLASLRGTTAWASGFRLRASGLR